MPELNRHFADLYKPVMEKATQVYVERLKNIAKECNCSRK
jgi:hypothetical protein